MGCEIFNFNPKDNILDNLHIIIILFNEQKIEWNDLIKVKIWITQ